MYVIRLMIVLFSSLLIVGCATKNENSTKRSCAIVLPDDINTSDTKKVDASTKSEDKTIVKNNSPDVSNTDAQKSVLLKQKLHKCGVKYVPWADRVKNDLILMPKILDVCQKDKLVLKGYILHSTAKKSNMGYDVKTKHLFLPFNWNESQIKGALTHLKKK